MMRCAHNCLDIANIALLMAAGFFGVIVLIAWMLGKFG